MTEDNKIVQLHDQPKPGEKKPATEPLNIYVNAMEDGTVQVDFSFSITRLSFSAIEAASFIGALAHATAAAIAKKK